MHDLNTINRLNGEAFADAIATYRTQGRHVLAKYEGLHLVSIETFTMQSVAQAAFDAAVDCQHGGGRAVLFAPVAGSGSALATRADVLRDQSEDRKQTHSLEQLAAFGRSTTPADQTLGDYINRKTI